MNMGKLIVDQFVTLDGVVQAPGGADEDTSGGFKHGGWQAAFADAEGGAVIVEGIERTEALLLGRRTYEIFANYWPKAPADHPIAAKFNAMPKYVASRTMKGAQWSNSTVLGPDLAREIERIKARHAETHVWGSGNLAQVLLREGLVDRLDLFIYPVLLGTGKRLFADGTVPTALKLVRSRAFGSGVILAAYEPNGTPRLGTVGASS
jgi:dihydrofolate reductase